MTPREKTLLTYFLLAVGLIVLALIVNGLLDAHSALDDQFFKLQKKATQAFSAQVEVAQSASEKKQRLVSTWEKKLFEKGKTPKHLEFVSQIQSIVQSTGLSIVSFSTVEEKPDWGWIQFNVRGTVGQWFDFIRKTNRQIPQTLYRNVAMKLTDKLDYFITVEVGYAALP